MSDLGVAYAPRRFATLLEHSVGVVALAYLLTFSTYGTHLPGSEKGWVDAKRCSVVGSPIRQYDFRREEYWRSRLNEHPYVLDSQARLLTLEAILAVCRHRRWIPHAVHVRSTHVHAVISGQVTPERIISDCKSYATRALRPTAAVDRRRYWTKHGSTRYLWGQTSLRAAVSYVLDGQGAKMAFYVKGLAGG